MQEINDRNLAVARLEKQVASLHSEIASMCGAREQEKVSREASEMQLKAEVDSKISEMLALRLSLAAAQKELAASEQDRASLRAQVQAGAGPGGGPLAAPISDDPLLRDWEPLPAQHASPPPALPLPLPAGAPPRVTLSSSAPTPVIPAGIVLSERLQAVNSSNRSGVSEMHAQQGQGARSNPPLHLDEKRHVALSSRGGGTDNKQTPRSELVSSARERIRQMRESETAAQLQAFEHQVGGKG